MNPLQKYPNLMTMGNTQPPTMPVDPPQMEEPQQPMVGPEAVEELRQLITEIERKVHNIEMTGEASKNVDFSMRQNFLQQLFDDLTQLGVDLTDTTSVAAFLTKIKEIDPELGMAFEEAIIHLMETPQEPESAQGLENPVEEEVPPEIPGMVETPANVAPAPASPPATPFSSL